MKEQNKIFTLPVVNWIISIFVGSVIPVISQTFLAQSITSLNNTPSIEPQTTYPTWLAITILWATITTYTIALSYMIWFIAKTQTHNSVWALIIFLISPITIWAILPLLLGA